MSVKSTLCCKKLQMTAEASVYNAVPAKLECRNSQASNATALKPSLPCIARLQTSYLFQQDIEEAHTGATTRALTRGTSSEHAGPEQTKYRMHKLHGQLALIGLALVLARRACDMHKHTVPFAARTSTWPPSRHECSGPPPKSPPNQPPAAAPAAPPAPAAAGAALPKPNQPPDDASAQQ